MGKVIIVSGANKGIGLAILEALVKEVPDSTLLLGSRDAARGQAAVEGVVSKLGAGYKERVKLLVLDVTSDASVQSALAVVKKEHGKIHGLVNNAGGSSTTLGGGPKNTIDLNLYGVKRMCEAFAPIMEDGGRIVQVSSGAGPGFVGKCSDEMKRFCLNTDMTWKMVEEKLVQPFLYITETLPAAKRSAALQAHGFDGGKGEGSWGEYGLSKAAVNCYTLALANMFPNLIITGCSPGFVATDLTEGFFTKSGKTAAQMGALTPDQGARSTVYLMTGDLAALPGFYSGWFFGSDSLRSPVHKSRDPGTPVYQGEFP